MWFTVFYTELIERRYATALSVSTTPTNNEAFLNCAFDVSFARSSIRTACRVQMCLRVSVTRVCIDRFATTLQSVGRRERVDVCVQMNKRRYVVFRHNNNTNNNNNNDNHSAATTNV